MDEVSKSPKTDDWKQLELPMELTTDDQPTQEILLPPITSGVELAKRIGAATDEGVVVALFPDSLATVVTQQASVLDKKGEHFHVILADCGPWGVRLLDLQSPNESEVKWWRVKEAAGIEQTDLIPIRWEGPIGEIPERYFRPDAFLGVRFYQHGPWFFPLEKPVVQSEVAEAQTLDVAVEAVAEGINGNP